MSFSARSDKIAVQLNSTGSIESKIMASSRKFFVGGNWKMNGDNASISAIVKFLNEGVNDSTSTGKDLYS